MSTFTPGELEVMRVLWGAKDPLKPAEIQDQFPREVGNAALRSILSILLEKGHVSRTRRGKAFYYSAKTQPQKEFRRAIKRVANLFCGGSSRMLIAQMIRDEKLTAEDIEELRRIAAGEEK